MFLIKNIILSCALKSLPFQSVFLNKVAKNDVLHTFSLPEYHNRKMKNLRRANKKLTTNYRLNGSSPMKKSWKRRLKT